MRDQEEKSLKAEEERHPLVPAVVLLEAGILLRVWDSVQSWDNILQRVGLVTGVVAGQSVGPMDEAELLHPRVGLP